MSSDTAIAIGNLVAYIMVCYYVNNLLDTIIPERFRKALWRWLLSMLPTIKKRYVPKSPDLENIPMITLDKWPMSAKCFMDPAEEVLPVVEEIQKKIKAETDKKVTDMLYVNGSPIGKIAGFTLPEMTQDMKDDCIGPKILKALTLKSFDDFAEMCKPMTEDNKKLLNAQANLAKEKAKLKALDKKAKQMIMPKYLLGMPEHPYCKCMPDNKVEPIGIGDMIDEQHNLNSTVVNILAKHAREDKARDEGLKKKPKSNVKDLGEIRIDVKVDTAICEKAGMPANADFDNTHIWFNDQPTCNADLKKQMEATIQIALITTALQSKGKELQSANIELLARLKRWKKVWHKHWTN